MNYYCYIIQSRTLDKYYIGETENIEERLILHNTGFFKGSYTSQGSDWKLFYTIKCSSRLQSRAIEGHIKRMKSRTYIENLPKFPEITQKLLLKYK